MPWGAGAGAGGGMLGVVMEVVVVILSHLEEVLSVIIDTYVTLLLLEIMQVLTGILQKVRCMKVDVHLLVVVQVDSTPQAHLILQLAVIL